MPTTETKTYKTVSPKAAKEQGYEPVTHGYMKDEHWMLDRAIADLEGAAHLLVMSMDGIAIYRRKCDMNCINRDKLSGRVNWV